MSTELHDFEDGKGPVQAARHSNGGGWVACTAYVNASAYVGPDAQVFGNAQVSGNARVFGDAWVSGNAQVSPIFVSGLSYPITITDHHLRAGCQMHTFAAWRSMSAEEIANMDGQKAANFYPMLIGIIDQLCKDREAQEVLK